MNGLFDKLKRVTNEKDNDDMSRFDVAWTPKGADSTAREFEEFQTRREAVKFARDLVAKGATKVFIDQYDSDGDLVAYKNVSGD